MSKKINFTLSESISELKSLRKKANSYRIEQRLLFLIYKDDNKFKTREDLAEYLNVSEGTLRNWSKTYVESGLNGLLKISSGGANNVKITSELHKQLESKLHNSTDPLLGYHHAVRWVRDEFGIELQYNTLRTYMKRHFGTKLKVPRKSHYKKDEKAIEVFKKPSN